MKILLAIHIAAGGAAIILGFLALFARKGGRTHVRAGRLFVFAMLTMAGSAAILGIARAQLGNVIAAVMTIYFVSTALVAMRDRSTPRARRVDVVGLGLSLGLVVVEAISAVVAYQSPRHALGGIPFGMFLFLGVIMTCAAVGDMRVLNGSGTRLAQRLSRHLWRMGFALFIAAGSFFSIRERVARVLPEPLTTGPMRALPIVVIFVATAFWMWRVRRRPVLAGAAERSMYSEVSALHRATPLSAAGGRDR